MRTFAAALVCLLSTSALAWEPPRRDDVKGAFAVRGGYALPRGEAERDLDLADVFTAAVPGWIELGARGEHTFVGFYFSYADARIAHCPPDVSCSGYSMRAGFEVLYSLLADAPVTPWVGVGIGWEGAKQKRGPDSTTASAFELGNLQLGIDVRAGRAVTLGPYVTASFARYSQADGEDIENPATHAWLQGGLRCEVRF